MSKQQRGIYFTQPDTYSGPARNSSDTRKVEQIESLTQQLERCVGEQPIKKIAALYREILKGRKSK